MAEKKPATVEELAASLRALGVPEEGIEFFKSDEGLQRTLAAGGAQAEAVLKYLTATYGAPESAYQQAAATLVPNLTGAVGEADISEMGIPAVLQNQLQTIPPNGGRGLGYSIDPSTGAVKYENGIIADPNTGDVIWEPTSTAAGTPLWLQQIQNTWDAEKIKTWRDRLEKWGYYTSGTPAGDELTGADLTALVSYHKAKYLNYGKPIAASTGLGAGGAEPDKFRGAEMRGLIRAKYREMYGVDPTEAEEEGWSEMLQTTYRRLQTKQQLDPGRAAQVTEAKFSEQVEGTEEAKFYRKIAEEKTVLRDALVNAAQLTDSLV